MGCSLLFGQGLGAVGRSGWLLQKVVQWKLVKHDVAEEKPVRGPDGLCIEVCFVTLCEMLRCDHPHFEKLV